MRFLLGMTKVSRISPMTCVDRPDSLKATGVDEVFQVIARKLVERRAEIERERTYGHGGGADYGLGGGGGRDLRVDASGPDGGGKKGGKCC